MKGKKPEVPETVVNSVILDPMPGTSKTRELDTMGLIKRDKLRDPERLTGRYEIRPIITQPLIDPESTAATRDLVMTTPESIRKSWSNSLVNPSVQDYMQGLMHIPGTIEDEMPAVSQAFADKVKAEGGIMTPHGLVCDPTVPVVGKRYMRLAKALFAVMFSFSIRHVEDAEYRIRSFGKRNKEWGTPDPITEHFIICLRVAIKQRHARNRRKPVYANKQPITVYYPWDLASTDKE